jgi:hypothetical protein
MKKLALAFFLVFISSNALALPLPSFHQGMSYDKARKKMLDLGWQIPAINYGCRGEETMNYGGLCDEYPDVAVCSGTGLGFCNFVFRDKNGNEFTITTAGQDNPLKVVGWRNGGDDQDSPSDE